VRRDVGVPLLIPTQTPTNGQLANRQHEGMRPISKFGPMMNISLPLVLLDKVKIIPTNNDGPIHLSTVACSGDDATPDRHSASEWAFLINVGSCNNKEIREI